MKICFITTGDIKSIATSKRALGMANFLIDEGWDVSIIMQDTKENHHRVELECSEKCNVFYFSESSAINELKFKNKIIKQLNPDYLYICAFVTRNIAGVGHRSKKLVEHSELQSGIPDVKGLKKFITLSMEYYSILYSDAILNASKYLEEVFIKRANKLGLKRPMLYFPYAYSSEVIQVVDIDYSNPKYEKYKDRKVFVFLGTITKNYGAFTLLEAMKEVKKEHPEALLLMLGKGRHYNDAVKYVNENNLTKNIYLPGFVEEEEISEYFSLTDYFISPMNDTIQDWARCPSKLYMYLPYKKPIITCKIGEPYQVLKNKGYYYTPGDSLELSKIMISVLDSNIKTIDINPEDHSWKTRSIEFNKWINNTFKK